MYTLGALMSQPLPRLLKSSAFSAMALTDFQFSLVVYNIRQFSSTLWKWWSKLSSHHLIMFANLISVWNAISSIGCKAPFLRAFPSTTRMGEKKQLAMKCRETMSSVHVLVTFFFFNLTLRRSDAAAARKTTDARGRAQPEMLVSLSTCLKDHNEQKPLPPSNIPFTPPPLFPKC